MESDRVILDKLRCLRESHQKNITRVVCSGGGAKGVVYPGAYKAMEQTGLLSGIKVFAGSSAGAITAALMAVGMPSATLRETLLSTNLRDLLGDSIGNFFRKNKPGICFITKDGKPIETFIRNHIVTTVISSLKEIDKIDTIASQYSDLNPLLIKLKGDQPSFTFSDLAILNRIFPDKFKKVIITAVKFPSGEIQIFDTEQTPEVEVALACRASASLPIILEPVTILVNGEVQRFIDGGMYDNLPTDYFDRESDRGYVKNTKPNQTLVFAFGGGVDNHHNKVFKALYGERWNEIINEKVLNKILDMTFSLYKKLTYLDQESYGSEEKSFVFIYTAKVALDQLIKDYKITIDGAGTLLTAIKKSMSSLIEKNQDFLKTSAQHDLRGHQIQEMIKIIHSQLKPELCKPSKLDAWKRTVLVKKLGGVHAPYKNTTREELCYQKIRSEYALRTVELRVGNIKTLDFTDATKFSRIMDAFGYLDTINHISNHELHNPCVFNSEVFFMDLVFHFNIIYHAVLNSAGKSLKHDPLATELNILRKQLEVLHKNPETISRQIYQLVKMKSEENLCSIEAFALSRAVEFLHQTLKPDDLFEETYKEGFKRSKPFSQSMITGQTFFRSGSLARSLQGKSMYDLYAHKDRSKNNTRSDKTFNILKQIRCFREAYDRWLQDTDDSENFYEL